MDGKTMVTVTEANLELIDIEHLLLSEYTVCTTTAMLQKVPITVTAVCIASTCSYISVEVHVMSHYGAGYRVGSAATCHVDSM